MQFSIDIKAVVPHLSDEQCIGMIDTFHDALFVNTDIVPNVEHMVWNKDVWLKVLAREPITCLGQPLGHVTNITRNGTVMTVSLSAQFIELDMIGHYKDRRLIHTVVLNGITEHVLEISAVVWVECNTLTLH